MIPRPVFETKYDGLPVYVYQTNHELGMAAAAMALAVLRGAVLARGSANLVLAAANSQLTFLHALRATAGLDWSRVRVLHMDDYIGIDQAHPACFAQFLRRHFLDYISPQAFYPISCYTANLDAVCQEYERLLLEYPVDLCAMGIGENGHVAFNDPPFADFDDPVWVKPVKLDERSRQQQVGEGHFASVDQVPTHAITLTIPALLSARHILVIVPEARKAEAVLRTLTGPIRADCPASILRRTAHAHLLLDLGSARYILPGPDVSDSQSVSDTTY